jgi:cysteinyl-tRNA synthetase
MDDDLNTARAMAVLFELARAVNSAALIAPAEALRAQEVLRLLAGVLGFALDERERGAREAAPFIELLLELRKDLRTAKQYELADRVRDGLGTLGVEVKDGPQGSSWQFSRLA